MSAVKKLPSQSQLPPRSLSISSNFTMDEQAKANAKQGIVSILTTDTYKSNTGLRRTLSADMSSHKWLAQNGFSSPSSVKKISSSHELLLSDSSSTSSDGDEDYVGLERCDDLDEKERLDIWTCIQEAKMNKEPAEGAPTSWTSILSPKEGDDPKTLPPPYVHPLVKRSASAMSDKSLEICTESLGSETGSEPEADDEEYDRMLGTHAETERAKHNNYLGSKKAAHSQSRSLSFPPPLPSLSRGDGASLSMKSSRNNGRLVLEAVTLSSQNNFQAQRFEGRLILSFVNESCSTEQEVRNVEAIEEEKPQPVDELDEQSVVYDGKCEGEEQKALDMEDEIPKVSSPLYIAKETTAVSMEDGLSLPGGAMNLHKLSMQINKPIGILNSNPRWGSKFNEVVSKFKVAEEEEDDRLSLPTLQPLLGRIIPTQPATTLNAYDFFWRNQPSRTSPVNTLTKQPLSSLKNSYVGTPISMVKKSCNEPRRSSLFWEPNCIATS